MKRLAIFIVCMLVCGVCWADVTAEIVSHDIDANGNIRVWTQYKVDDVEVVSQYPKIDGKYVWATRFDVFNFYEMTDGEIKVRILEDGQAHADTLIQREYIKKNNDTIIKTRLEGLVGSKVTKSTSVVQIDTDKDGEPDRELTLKTDGTKTEKDIEKVVVTPIIE